MKTFQQLILQYSHSVILSFSLIRTILRRLKMPYAYITLLQAIRFFFSFISRLALFLALLNHKIFHNKNSRRNKNQLKLKLKWNGK